MISRTLLAARAINSRSIHLLLAPAGTLSTSQTAMPYIATRSFAKKRKSRKNADIPTEDESEEVVAAQEEVVHAEPEPVPVVKSTDSVEHAPVSKDLFSAWKNDVIVTQSVPNNKALSKEDTIEGRYAGVLFTTASANEELFDVYDDMMYLQELHKNCESFRMFTENAGVGIKEIKALNGALMETADFKPLTMRFLEVLAEHKRLVFIKEIS